MPKENSQEIYNKSVTKNDLGRVSNGSVLQLIIPMLQGQDRLALPPALPPYWSYAQDAILRATVFHEAMWAASVSIAITKVASLSWEVEGKAADSIITHTQELILQADGRRVGWVGFLSKQLRDYLTTNNGSHVEIVRATQALGSKIIGLRHLDSQRCVRTGDPEIPLLYKDRFGNVHELKDYQCMSFSDMPDPSDMYYGVGFCAAHRSYKAIYKLSCIEQYLAEKVSGLRPLAIYIVNGVMDTQLKGAITAAQQDEVSRGLVAYMGAVIVGVAGEVQPQVVTIPLAELPDRFARKEEFDLSLYTYADNLGLDIQDLMPLGGQALGTGAQSQVLHDKASGKGLVSWKQDFVHMLNDYVMPDTLTYAFIEKDYRDIIQKATISKTKADTAKVRIDAGITSPAIEAQIMADEDELDQEFVPEDITGTENLTDTDQADEALSQPVGGELVAGTGTPQPATGTGRPAPVASPFRGTQTVPPMPEAPQMPKMPSSGFVWGKKEIEQLKGLTDMDVSEYSLNKANEILTPQVVGIAKKLVKRAKKNT